MYITYLGLYTLCCAWCTLCMSLITAVFTVQSRSSVWLQFQHKLYPSQWFLNLTMLISSLQCLPQHSMQGKAERSTVSPSRPMSMESSVVTSSSKLPLTIKPSTSHFSLAYTVTVSLCLNKDACRLYSKARGRGAPAVKKLVLLRRRRDVLLGTSYRRQNSTSYGRRIRTSCTTSWRRRGEFTLLRRPTSAHDVVGTNAWRRHDVVKTSNFLTGSVLHHCRFFWDTV